MGSPTPLFPQPVMLFDTLGQPLTSFGVTVDFTETNDLLQELIDQGNSTTPVPVKQTGNEYETVAASQTAQVMGSTGAAGDFLQRLIIIPASASPGNVLLLDNATSITIFPGGTDSIMELKPWVVEIGMNSASGAWKITTGANVSVIAIGDFT